MRKGRKKGDKVATQTDRRGGRGEMTIIYRTIATMIIQHTCMRGEGRDERRGEVIPHQEHATMPAQPLSLSLSLSSQAPSPLPSPLSPLLSISFLFPSPISSIPHSHMSIANAKICILFGHLINWEHSLILICFL